MLPKSRRLSRQEIITVKSRGTRVNSSLGQLIIAPGTGKVAIITPLTLHKRAHERNRLRRNIYRSLQQLSPISKDFLLYPSRKTLDLTPTELLVALTQIYK